MIEATIALCKCKESHKTFGVRFEKNNNGTWKYTWAFPIKGDAAKREGYDRSRIQGFIMEDPDYPGCPYCGGKTFVICSCGRLNCNISHGRIFTCEWCGKTGTLTNYNGSGFTGGGDV